MFNFDSILDGMTKHEVKRNRSASTLSAFVCKKMKDGTCRVTIPKSLLPEFDCVHFDIFEDEKNIALKVSKDGGRKIINRKNSFQFYIPAGIDVEYGDKKIVTNGGIIFISKS